MTLYRNKKIRLGACILCNGLGEAEYYEAYKGNHGASPDNYIGLVHDSCAIRENKGKLP